MIKHFTEFAPAWLHNKAKEQLLSPYIDWHFPGNGGYYGDIDKACFAKLMFDAERNHSDWSLVESLPYVLDQWIDANKTWFNFRGLNRCILNFYTPGMTIGWHNDHSKLDHYTLIYYVNDSDGGTEFKDCKVMHKENTGILLLSNDDHKNIESTVPRRISVAWIIVGDIIDEHI
jgi:hypothetical protein